MTLCRKVHLSPDYYWDRLGSQESPSHYLVMPVLITVLVAGTKLKALSVNLINQAFQSGLSCLQRRLYDIECMIHLNMGDMFLTG